MSESEHYYPRPRPSAPKKCECDCLEKIIEALEHVTWLEQNRNYGVNFGSALLEKLKELKK